MATYRVFMLGNDDHIVGVELLDCPTDFEAMVRAPDIGNKHKAVEIWDLARLVGRVDLSSRQTPSKLVPSNSSRLIEQSRSRLDALGDTA
jgi:hypothetical protein